MSQKALHSIFYCSILAVITRKGSDSSPVRVAYTDSRILRAEEFHSKFKAKIQAIKKQRILVLRQNVRHLVDLDLAGG